MRMKKIFSNNCGCNFVFYEIAIFQIVTLQGKLNRAGAVQISKIWKKNFSKIHLYTLCDIPPNDLGLITPKCIFWISLVNTYDPEYECNPSIAIFRRMFVRMQKKMRERILRSLIIYLFSLCWAWFEWDVIIWVITGWWVITVITRVLIPDDIKWWTTNQQTRGRSHLRQFSFNSI